MAIGEKEIRESYFDSAEEGRYTNTPKIGGERKKNEKQIYNDSSDSNDSGISSVQHTGDG